MKFILSILFIGFNAAFSATYYITPNGSGTGTGLDSSNTLAYATLHDKSLASGDNVYFKAGNVYFGQHFAKNGVNYNRYSSGVNPIISGFTILTTWTLLSGNIFYASLDVPVLHGVTIDGQMKPMGRYPNAGLLSYESHSGNTSITDNQLTGSWVGAEVVIRKVRWVWDRHFVTAQSGGTLTYNSTNWYGSNSAYSPFDNNGYFIQDHLNTLDQDGEWFYDKTAKRLYAYFAGGTASGRIVKASTLNQSAPFNGASNITMSNIDFEGGNTAVINNGSTGISFINCNFRQIAGNAIYAASPVNMYIGGCSITDVQNNGIQVEGYGTNTIVEGVTVRRSGIVVGMGQNSEASYTPINIDGQGTIIKTCYIVSSGWNGIQFSGSDVLVENNYIDSTGIVKDDCGGIYTYNNGDGFVSNRVIRKNIIRNSIGAPEGTQGDPNGYDPTGKANGIYLDDHSKSVIVDSNSIGDIAGAGIFTHNLTYVTISNNNVLNAKMQWLHVQDTTKLRGMVMINNNFVAKSADQYTAYIDMNVVSDDPSLWGTFNSNFYARPISEGNTIWVKNYLGSTTTMSLNTWKSTYGLDKASLASQVSVSVPTDLTLWFNYGANQTPIALSSVYATVANTRYTKGSSSLPRYGSSILAYQSALTPSVTTYKTSAGPTSNLYVISGKLLK